MSSKNRFEIQAELNGTWTTVGGYNKHSMRDTNIVKVMAKYPSPTVNLRILPSGMEKLAEVIERRRYQD